MLLFVWIKAKTIKYQLLFISFRIKVMSKIKDEALKFDNVNTFSNLNFINNLLHPVTVERKIYKKYN